MKFAVVEYTSKSGQIWQHQPDRPNYLADPTTEIDPTSFGGYVSALAGEHIPLTALINPTVLKKVYKRLTGHWPAGYSIDYLKQFDVLLVVHQLSDAHELVTLLRRIRTELPHVLILGVPTQPYGLLKAALEADAAAMQHFADFMNECHVFLTIVKSTKSWYESLTDTPVEYMPQIYPVEYASRFYKPREQKEKIIFVAGVTDRPRITQGLAVARELQKQLPDYIIHVADIPDLSLDLAELAGAQYKIIPFEPWQKHLEYLSTVMLVINTDYTQTRGRVQMDCAAVGTPSLGGNSDAAVDLFPHLISQPNTPDRALVDLGSKLLEDAVRYKQVAETAANKLNQYTYKLSTDRLRSLIARHKGSG